MSKKPKPATVGERIVKNLFQNWRVPWDQRDNVNQIFGRRIDAAIRRAVKKERERCMKIAICTTDPWVNKYKAIKEGAIL